MVTANTHKVPWPVHMSSCETSTNEVAKEEYLHRNLSSIVKGDRRKLLFLDIQCHQVAMSRWIDLTIRFLTKSTFCTASHYK